MQHESAYSDLFAVNAEHAIGTSCEPACDPKEASQASQFVGIFYSMKKF